MKTGDFFITEYKFYADLPSSVLRIAYYFSRYVVKKIGSIYYFNKNDEQKEWRPAGRHDLNTLWI